MATVESDAFISSLTTLKQLLHQQQKLQQQLKSPNTNNSRKTTKIDESGLEKKLQNAEKIIENERSLRASLEKAFEELTTNRKLLQEQLDEIQQQQQLYTKKQQRTIDDDGMDVDSSSDWDKERIPLIKKILQMQEEANNAQQEHAKYVQEQTKLLSNSTSEIEKLQKQLEIVETTRSTEYAKLQKEIELLRSNHDTVLSIVCVI
jgi:DNA repair exonuclease SbcCD ATPase subunit